MTKEQAKSKSIVNLITGHAPWDNWNGISRIEIERAIANGLSDHAKQQAIAFDIWKIKNHWVWDTSILRYFKWENDNKHETRLSHEEIYDRFIEQQNKP